MPLRFAAGGSAGEGHTDLSLQDFVAEYPITFDPVASMLFLVVVTQYVIGH